MNNTDLLNANALDENFSQLSGFAKQVRDFKAKIEAQKAEMEAKIKANAEAVAKEKAEADAKAKAEADAKAKAEAEKQKDTLDLSKLTSTSTTPTTTDSSKTTIVETKIEDNQPKKFLGMPRKVGITVTIVGGLALLVGGILLVRKMKK